MAQVGTTTLGQGTCTGASDHVPTNIVKVVKNTDGRHTATLADTFSLDGAPNPRVGFGKDGTCDKTTGMGLLKSLNGDQTVTAPPLWTPPTIKKSISGA